jgi:hypothetical protein
MANWRKTLWRHLDRGVSLLGIVGMPALTPLRLPNGNLLVCEGPYGRLFEVTPEGETLWEFGIASAHGADRQPGEL